MRQIIIGDVHGCYDELVALLLKIKFDDRKDRILFLGDYTDRGPKSYEVYKLLRGLKLDMGNRCVLLYGNHEDLIIQYFDNGEFDFNYKFNGGKTTLKSFKQHNLSLRRYTDWVVKNTVPYYKCKVFQACHGGLDNRPIEEVPIDILIWDRIAVKKGTYTGPLTIVGHTPLKRPAYIGTVNDEIEYFKFEYGVKYEIPLEGLIAMDTACVMGGKLTALIMENNTMEFVCQENMKGESYY